MLNDAANSATPTKYAQNNRHGMYEGTPSIMNFAPVRCSAPKTASGIAKHKLLSATTLSRPRADAISLFAAHTPTSSSTTPAPHIETAAREISINNVATMFGFMRTPSVNSHRPFHRAFSRSLRLSFPLVLTRPAASIASILASRLLLARHTLSGISSPALRRPSTHIARGLQADDSRMAG